MTAPELKQALRLVVRLGLAPLARVGNTRPKDISAAGYQRWFTRRREVEGEVATKLRAEGATITEHGCGATLRFAGITASSTMGIGQALNNWKSAAEKRLKGEKR